MVDVLFDDTDFPGVQGGAVFQESAGVWSHSNNAGGSAVLMERADE